MSNTKRCGCRALSTSKICLNKYVFKFGQERYCTIHARMKFNDRVGLIQKIWRGYRTRGMLNKVYKRLPEELQEKINFLVRENYLIKKHHHQVIDKIIQKKTKEIVEIIYSSFSILETSEEKIKKIYELYIKYFEIITEKRDKDFLYRSQGFISNFNFINIRHLFIDYNKLYFYYFKKN